MGKSTSAETSDLAVELTALRAEADQLRTQSADLRAEAVDLRAETAELRSLVDRLSQAVFHEPARTTAVEAATQADSAGGRLSRRGLLRALPAVAAVGATGAIATVATASPAAAAAGDALILGAENDAGATTTTLLSTARVALSIPGPIESPPLETRIGRNLLHVECYHAGEQEPSFQVNAATGDAYSVPGSLQAGDLRPDHAFVSVQGAGIAHLSDFGFDALHASTAGPGTAVTGTVVAGGVAVKAEAHDLGVGLRASSEAGHALEASTTDTAATRDAVVLTNAGLGRALFATSTSTANNAGAVTGVNKGTGAGVWGTLDSDTSTGAAVVGWAGAKGRGGRFKGGAAALNLAPSKAAAPPATGAVGDLFLDSSARLWLYKGAAGWKQLG